MGEDDDEDVFFTEEDYEMFSLSRTHNIRARRHEELKALKNWRDVVAKEKERKQAKKQLKQTKTTNPSKDPTKQQQKPPQASTNVSSQKPKPKPKAAESVYSLLSPNPKIRYPTFSRLTLAQHKKFLELQAKYGSKGIRVTTSKQSAEHQQWRQLGALIYQDQQDFNSFAEYIANNQPESYTCLPSGALKYIKDCLKKNQDRVESLPQHYAVLQTVTLNPGVPLPSDPTLQRIGSPIFVGKSPELVIPPLEDHKVVLKTSEAECENVSEAQDNVSNLNNCQKLAEMYKADIVLSSSSFFTLVNNHAPLYEHQWEIPIEVKESSSGKVAFIEEPLMRHQYYPYDASGLFHNLILKQMLMTEDNKKYCKFVGRTEEEEGMTQERLDTTLPEEPEAEEDVDEFGSMSLTDLETFGSDLRSPRSRTPVKEERMQESNADLAVKCEGNETPNVVKVDSNSMVVSEQMLAVGTDVVDPGKNSSSGDVSVEILDDTKSSSGSTSLGRTLSSEDSHLASVDSSAKSENIGSDAEGAVKLVAAAKRKVVKVAVRRRSTSIDNEAMATDEACVVKSQELQDVGDEEENPDITMQYEDKEKKSNAQKIQQKPNVERVRLMSDSSDDGHNLVIMVESDAGSSPPAPRGRPSPKVPERKGNSVEQDPLQMDKEGEETLKKEGIVGTCSGHHRHDDVKSEQEDVDTSAVENNRKDEQTKGKSDEEVPEGRMATRRSSRIRKQSSSDGNTSSGQMEEVPLKRKRGRPRKQANKEGQAASMEMNQEKKDAVKNLIAEHEISPKSLACEKDKKGKELSCGTPRSLRTRSRKDNSADSGKGSKTARNQMQVSEEEKSANQDQVEQSINQTKDTADVSKRQGTAVVSKGEDANPKVATKRKGTAKKVSPSKSGTPRKLGNKDPSERNKAESTIDEIMRLQEKMLTRQKSSSQQHSPGQSQSHSSQSHGQGHQGGREATSTEEIQAVSSFMPEGMDLEHPTEGSWAYSLWKFGRLRLLTQSKCPCMLKGEAVNVGEKMEYQSDLGLQMQTASDLTRMWLNLYLNPGSKFLRGRIDSRTSEILSWECLDGTTIVQPQQTFNPGMCMKVLYLILGKLAALSQGRYLLRHRPGDAHICIYQCVDPTAKNVRAPYDLHAAHKASQLMTSLPPTIPWVPLDPSAPYRSNRWRGCVPLTFPPCPPDFKHPSTQHGGKHRKKNKKKKKKR